MGKSNSAEDSTKIAYPLTVDISFTIPFHSFVSNVRLKLVLTVYGHGIWYTKKWLQHTLWKAKDLEYKLRIKLFGISQHAKKKY